MDCVASLTKAALPLGVKEAETSFSCLGFVFLSYAINLYTGIVSPSGKPVTARLDNSGLSSIFLTTVSLPVLSSLT